jgi:hypothetical protein
VEVLVAVLPLEGFDDEIAVLRRDGVPYVVLRAPLLLEELAQPLEGRRLVVVPKGATVRVLEAAALARAALEARCSPDDASALSSCGPGLPRRRLAGPCAPAPPARARGRVPCPCPGRRLRSGCVTRPPATCEPIAGRSAQPVVPSLRDSDQR